MHSLQELQAPSIWSGDVENKRTALEALRRCYKTVDECTVEASVIYVTINFHNCVGTRSTLHTANGEMQRHWWI